MNCKRDFTADRHVILIVEDDRDIREGLASVLSEEGFPVVTAANGLEAIDRLRTIAASLILLDLMMPVMSGWEFREAQRRDPALSRIPVVVITGDNDAKRKAELLGAAGYVSKPFDLDDVLTCVKRFSA